MEKTETDRNLQEVEEVRDHPVVEKLEQTGFPDGKIPMRFYCPVCGEECESYYIDESDMIWGCECCLETVLAAEYDEQ